MQRSTTALGLLATFFLASQAIAAPIPDGRHEPERTLPVAGVITNPDWVRRPNGEDFAKFYPALPQFIGLSGRAIISCVVNSAGALQDCSVVAETPQGFRFGQAAISMASLFHMRPQTIDGNPVTGGTVRIPIMFILPSATPPKPPTISGNRASTKAIAAARRIAAAWLGGPAMAAHLAQLEQTRGRTNLTREEALAADAMRKAYVNSQPMIADRLSVAYASVFSEQELVDIAAFLETPSGRAWIGRQGEMTAAWNAGLPAAFAAILESARADLCGQITCLAADGSEGKPIAKAASSPPRKDQ